MVAPSAKSDFSVLLSDEESRIDGNRQLVHRRKDARSDPSLTTLDMNSRANLEYIFIDK